MKLQAKLKSFKKYFGMTAELRNSDGDVIDTITIGKNGKGKKLTFEFDKSDLNGDNDVEIVFQDDNGDAKNFEKGDNTFDLSPDDQDFDFTISSKKKKKNKVKIKLQGDELSEDGAAVDPPTPEPTPVPTPEPTPADTTPPVISSGAAATVVDDITGGTVVYTATATDNSPPVTFALGGSDASNFSINSANGQVSINASPDASVRTTFNFDVVATDAAGNSSTQAVTISVTAANTGGDTIVLTPFRDVYDANTGTTVNTGVQTPRAERLSSQDNTINGIAGTLGTGGQLDSLTDPSTTDNDTLNLATDAASDLQAAIATGALTNLSNVENLVVTGTADDSADINFSQVQELKSLDLNGSFSNNADIVVRNWIDSAGINSFDFSGASNSTNATFGFDVLLANNTTATTAEALSFTGSAGDDTFEASIGAATMLGGAGADTLTGSTLNSTYIKGGLGSDTANLVATNAATDTVSIENITNLFDQTTVNGFVGFLDTANNPTGTQHDKIEVDAGTVTNLTAGATVQGKNVAQLTALLGTPEANNHIIVDNFGNISAANLSAHGTSWMAYGTDTGDLYFAPDGNFVNTEVVAAITFVGADDAHFLPDQNLTVIA